MFWVQTKVWQEWLTMQFDGSSISSHKKQIGKWTQWRRCILTWPACLCDTNVTWIPKLYDTSQCYLLNCCHVTRDPVTPKARDSVTVTFAKMTTTTHRKGDECKSNSVPLNVNVPTLINTAFELFEAGEKYSYQLHKSAKKKKNLVAHSCHIKNDRQNTIANQNSGSF